MVAHLPETVWCTAKHYAAKQVERPTGPVAEEHVDHVLSQYDEDAVFVHVGLSDVNGAVEGNPYEFLLERLDAHFSSILVPGFTPSFRDTGYYHKKKSTPEVGTFSRLFFEDADYRTDDAIHSILVKGDYRFEGCDHHDTFSPEGCYAQLDADGVRYLNVGTPWLVCTQLHYAERALDVPYVETVEHEGTIYYGDGDGERIRQGNYDKNRYVYYWDRIGIQRDLVAAGVLDHYDLNGLKLLSVTADDLLTELEAGVAEDPYYMVRQQKPGTEVGDAIRPRS